MDMFKYVYFLALIFINVSGKKENGFVHLNLLSTSAHDYTREKRDAGHMPEHLAFEVNSPIEKHVLRLTRSGGLPTYVTGESGTEKLSSNVKDHAVYVDRSRRSVVMVKRSEPGTDKYHLTGDIQLGDTLVHIEPSKRAKRSNESLGPDEFLDIRTDGVHIILKATPIFYGDDARHPHPNDRKRRSPNETLSMYLDENIRRIKRQATEMYTIELCLIADFSVYSYYLAENNNNAAQATAAIEQFYSYYAEQIKVRYDNVNEVDNSIDIDIVISGLVILTTAAQSAFSETNKNGNELNSGLALTDINSFTVNPPQGVVLPASDHYMYFTRYDLTSTNSNPPTANAGLANLGTLCDPVGQNNLATSIIEDDLSSSVGAVAAHELGHGLSAEHDEPANGCTETFQDNFVMSSVLQFPNSVAVGGRPWTFSQCSINFFKNFLSNVNCADDNNYGGGFLIPTDLAGQVFNSDDQCRQVYGSTSYLCRNVNTYNDADGFVELCYLTFCLNGNSCNAIFPQRYTTCGNKKWCIEGVCTAAAIAPETPGNQDTCPQGDQPGFTCESFNCQGNDPRCCEFCAPDVTPRPVSETTRPVSETTRSVSETTRSVSETTRPVSETTRPVSETTRPVSETTRPVSETTRPVSETTRPVSETTRPVSETTRPVSETTRPVSETTRSVSETTRPVSDTTRPVSETTQPVSETTRTVSETTRPVSETTRPVSETTRPVSETTRPVSETTRPVSETTRPVSETTRPVSETTRPVSETTRPVSETTRSVSETTRPVSDTTRPVSETTQPVSETTRTVSETTRPVSETTRPVSETTSPATSPGTDNGGNGGLNDRCTFFFYLRCSCNDRRFFRFRRYRQFICRLRRRLEIFRRLQILRRL